MSSRIVTVVIVSVCVLAAVAGRADAADAAAPANQWILDHFADVPTYTGNLGGLDPSGNSFSLIEPALFKDFRAQGGYYGLAVHPASEPATRPARVAFVNGTISNQTVDGQYGASIITFPTGKASGDQADPDLPFDTYFSHVTITPNLPPWVDYDTTNFDGITFDGGWASGHVYAEDLTIDNWADAAIDVKGQQIQVVRMRTGGDGTNNGLNTLKLWNSGPHYIVDSTINNSRWLTKDPIGDGGLVSTMYGKNLEIRIWNSTFNGSPTLPRSKITCWYGGTPADVKITYLTVDPRTTGEMHPMFSSTDATVLPTITAQPLNTSVSAGQTATFSVTASGSPAPVYQWGKNGANISGATSSSYTTPATVIGDNGATFRCVVTNSAGTATSTDAVLTVR